MKLFQQTKDDLDEIVFENRNKLYGAYAIRKSYDGNLLKASASSFLLSGLLITAMYVSPLLSNNEIPACEGYGAGGKTILPDITVERVIEIISAAASSSVNADNGRYQIVRDNQAAVLRSEPPRPDLSLNPQGYDQGPGTGEDPFAGGPGNDPGGEPGGGPAPDPIFEDNAVIDFAQVMPVFPGGLDAMRAYLARELRYPEKARELGIEGKVVISFVVNTGGAITNIHIERSLGYGCDDEAQRVVSEMPQWTPGMQNGRKRSVKLILPIQFNLR